ncbi:MAG: hypothetical protein KatS3mg108_2207 [Isosphaeraceae bacterium]|nr:MAG: hypothetical protein KatS3mg108_2207 [Isosphaeraceae bacterium]
MVGRSWAVAAWLIAALVAGCGELADESPRGEPTGRSGATPTGRAAGRTVRFVGFDASPPLVAALRAGQIQGLVLQDPVRMGELGVRTMVAHLEGQPHEAQISTGELLATPENMDDELVAARLNPPKADNSADSALPAQKAKTWRIMVIPKGATHVHWQSVHYGAQRAAAELGRVELLWLAPTKEDDRLEQIALVQRAVAARVDGIVIAPLDAQALVAPIEDAIGAGIPVVIIDSALASSQPVAYVATDNYRGGVLAAERLAELLDGQGRVILLRYAPNSEATEQREKGFTDTIARYPGITLISQDQYAGATAESAQRIAQQLITRFRGEFDGIFTPNESSTVGMLRALEDAGMLAAAP